MHVKYALTQLDSRISAYENFRKVYLFMRQAGKEISILCGALMARKGYFILTDISGYTEFLTRSELDHAQDALQNLFDVLPALPVPASFGGGTPSPNPTVKFSMRMQGFNVGFGEGRGRTRT